MREEVQEMKGVPPLPVSIVFGTVMAGLGIDAVRHAAINEVSGYGVYGQVMAMLFALALFYLAFRVYKLAYIRFKFTRKSAV